MAGRPKHYRDEELIDRATRVFWEKGYTAASAQDLMKAMDIGQGSFYRSFPGGKMELFQKSLRRFLKKSLLDFQKDLNASDCPVQFIKDFFFAITERNPQERKNGCFLGNSLMEWSNLDEATKALSAELLGELRDSFENALLRAQKEGRLSPEKSPRTLALFLINLWNGINVTQRMGMQQSSITEVLEMNLSILE